MKRAILILLIINICAISAQNKFLAVQTERYNYDRQKYELFNERVPYLDKSKYLPNQIYIKFKNTEKLTNLALLKESITQTCSLVDIRLNPIAKFGKGNKLQSTHSGLDRLYRISFSDTTDPYTLCEKLNQNKDVEYAVPVFRRHTREFTPNDEDYAEQWSLPAINMSKAWELGGGDSNVVIGIVDSGVDILHNDLIPNLWINKDEIPNDGIDNDGNGYIDDVNGWDFIGNIDYYKAMAGDYKPDNYPKPNTSGNSHGSNAAGVACAATNNTIGIASPAFNCKIMSVKCATDNLDEPLGFNDILEGFEGILYAAQNGADIINCSWGGPGFNSAEKDMVDAAVFDNGAVIVAAGVNSYSNFDLEGDYPISYGNVIGISAINSEDDFSKSGYGVSMCLYAPGFSILSTMNGGHYAHSSGTSLASPLAASVAALIKSHHPDWGYKEIYHQLRSSAVPFPNVTQEKRKIFFGKLDAYGAVTNNFDATDKYNKTPGISFLSLDCNDESYLMNPGLNHSKLTIKNYLSAAEGVTITITPLTAHLTLGKSSYFVPTLAAKETSSLDVDFYLKESNPWFSGTCPVLIEYKSENYYNVEIVQIPIEVKSTNRFRLAKDFKAYIYPRWTSAHSLSTSYLFAGGYIKDLNIGYLMRWGGPGDVVKEFSGTVPITTYGINKDVALFGTMAVEGGNGANILKVNFTDKTIDTTAMNESFIDVLKVFMIDPQNGIALGSLAEDSKWYIAKTADTAKTWVSTPINIAPLENENSFWASYYADKAKLTAFGTNMGRVIYSNDLLNWSVSKVWDYAGIELITFLNDKDGICIFGDNRDVTDNRYSAFTNNGGKTWTRNTFDFLAFETVPVYLSSPENSGYAIAQCMNGEVYITKDLGKSWQPQLSWEYQSVQTGFGINDNDRIRMWQLGNDLCYLDFLKGSPVYVVGLMANVDTLDFGTFKVDSTVTREIELVNTGPNPITIFSLNYENPEIFQSINQIKTVLLPSEKTTLKVAAQFGENGKIISNLKVKYDISELNIPIKANIIGGGAVDDPTNEIKIYPNPAIDYVVVQRENQALEPLSIKIIDISGKIVFEKSSINSNFTTIETTKFENGVYIIEITVGQRKIHKKIIINAPLLDR
ncbi:MAG: S8 family serine peptidase [bacterium]